jgi:hypothetical protein
LHDLLSPFDVLEARLISPAEVWVSEGDSILAFAHLFEVIHVELHGEGITWRWKDW